MIYNRNKDAFKRTTHKVQHGQAQTSIISLVKDMMKKQNDKSTLEVPENRSDNLPAPRNISPATEKIK